MSDQIALLVLAAAFMHAFWNALVKGAKYRLITMGMIAIGHGLVGIWLVLTVMPPIRESWPFLAASTIIHWFYFGFLGLAYRFGDLSRVYPISRGMAPLIVAAGGAFFAGDTMSLAGWVGVTLVSTGILILVMEKGVADRRAIVAAILTGLMISAYTIVDGMGGRAAMSIMGYAGWLFLLESTVAIWFLWAGRSNIRALPLRNWGLGIFGGVISAVAYVIVIYAKSEAPFGAVSALRESSVLIAAFIGVLWFGERPIAFRLAASIFVVAGVACLVLVT